MSVDSSSSSIASKQNTSLPMWTYFGVKVDEEGKATDDGVVICRICNMAVKVRGSNTSNLVLHLKVHHPLKHVEVVMKRELKKCGFSSKSVSLEQTTISCAFERARKYERSYFLALSNAHVVRIGRIGMNSQMPSHSA